MVIVNIEIEVELPRRDGLRALAIFVRKRNTNLNNLEKVDILLYLHVLSLL